MKKILLIISLALLWSFNVNAQVQTETKATDSEFVKAISSKDAIPAEAVVGKKIAVEIPGGGLKKAADAVSNPNCRTRFTPQEALDATADGNVNMFGAVYSGVTQRTCEEKLPENIQRAVASDKLIGAREFKDYYEAPRLKSIEEMPPAAK